ncbi:hypothetical protein SAY87_004312 [Trapa incisa]|uniref:C2H2-type domain-containing protein n=1 Tax=Trapa incisa TaxID=236973 RepID=A0AAN7PSC7_9MYRT|nr:hypothetical protein SAY87_004312 [Trapa incisa]
MIVNTSPPSPLPPSDPFNNCLDNGTTATNKRKRRPAGTPDPDAEVVSLSPRTLLESDRYVCEICNQGFQRDQNLQMHRRRHKVPWKLLKRPENGPLAARKRVFVCPEKSCLHHDPCHALGDLVGIKKHFRRKHSNHKQWVCGRCSKGYAVQSDYKAHLKTCGTRGHSCDCGRVFSRVESFIEHQDSCSMNRLRADSQGLQPPCLSRTASSPSRSSETHSTTPRAATLLNCCPSIPANSKDYRLPIHEDNIIVGTPLSAINYGSNSQRQDLHNLDLQLAIGSSGGARIGMNCSSYAISLDNHMNHNGDHNRSTTRQGQAVGPSDILSMAIAEKEYAKRLRMESSRELEEAEREIASAKMMRQQAQAELEKAMVMKEIARKQIDSAMLMMTCQSCKQRLIQPEQHHYHRDLFASINGSSGVSAMRGDRSS